MSLAALGIVLLPLGLLAQQGLASVWNPANLFGRGASATTSDYRAPADVLASRSPGTRDPDALYSIKPERVAPLSQLADVFPHERVLSVVRDRPGLIDPALFDPAELADPGLFGSGPLGAGPLGFGPSDLASFGVPALTADGEGGGPGAVGGGGGGGGAGGGLLLPVVPAEAPTVNAEVPPSVPEPSTWLTMIVGFFALAATLRRRPAQTAASRLA